jgi:hypothetical protein
VSAAALIDLIRDLVGFLAREPLAVEDVAARVGPVVRDPGGLIPLELQPVLPDVRAARLARFPDSSVPHVLSLEPAPAARPTVAALKAAFGDYRRSLTDFEQPRQVIFYPPGGARWKVAVLAQLLPGGNSLAEAQVASLALRRDPVTPEPA